MMKVEGRVCGLNLSESFVVDVSKLCNMKRLNLSGCEGLLDISKLGNVKSLNILNCPNVIDVCNLAKLKILTIGSNNDRYECKITDVASLSTVHTLKICGLSINDVCSLKN